MLPMLIWTKGEWMDRSAQAGVPCAPSRRGRPRPRGHNDGIMGGHIAAAHQAPEAGS